MWSGFLAADPLQKKTTATIETVETSYRKKDEIKFANLITIVLIVISIGVVKTNNLLFFVVVIFIACPSLCPTMAHSVYIL